MNQRSIASIVLLSILTLGIYFVVWTVKTKNEMNERHAAQIPTAWLMWVPFWWAWKYCAGVERATDGKMSQINAFLLLHIFPVVGQVLIQLKANEAAAAQPARAQALAA
jgi:cytochrome bd-type quinol oxidase subunit 2